MNKATEADWEGWLRVLEDPESRKAQKVLEECGEGSPRCCLGHLCSISPEVERVVPLEEEETTDRVTYKSISPPENSEQMQLPKVLAKKFGITPIGDFNRTYSDEEVADIVGVDPGLLWHHDYEDLAELNDNSELSLPHIAAFIRHLRWHEGFRPWESWVERDGV